MSKQGISRRLATLLLISLLGTMVACSSESTTSKVGSGEKAQITNPSSSLETPQDKSSKADAMLDQAKEQFAVSSPENDTDIGLKVTKIDIAEQSLTDDQKAVIEYFDSDYLMIWDYEALRRYPQVFDASQVCVCGVVTKVISMDANEYQLVIWMNVTMLDNEWLPDRYKGAYLLISGKTGENWFIEGDVLEVYGRCTGIETQVIDGTSYTLPRITVQRALPFTGGSRDGIVFMAGGSDRFDLPSIKKVAKAIFGDNIEIRKPVIGTDFPEETAMLMAHWGQDMTETNFVVELENQSNAKFTRFLMSKGGGNIRDIKDAMSDYESGYERYFEFAADFSHYFLFTYDQSLETLTLEYYDNSLNKVWKREFEETTSAKYDFTKNNIYLSANNELYIINTETGEDTYAPTYVGSKAAIRKTDSGILMISNSKSDGVMMANLDGSIKWKTNLENDVDNVQGLQIVGDRIVFDYEWSDDANPYRETYVAIDKNNGQILISATPNN